MNEEAVLAFVQGSIKSIWALELLLLLRRERQRAWRLEDLVRESRSSNSAVLEALAGLMNAGLVSADAGGFYRYHPTSAELDKFAAETEGLNTAKPLAIAKAIMSTPNDKLRIFADAFKLKGK